MNEQGLRQCPFLDHHDYCRCILLNFSDDHIWITQVFLNIRRRRRKIRLIESNAKCRHLKNLTVKVLCGRCFICLRHLPNNDPILLPPYTLYLGFCVIIVNQSMAEGILCCIRIFIWIFFLIKQVLRTLMPRSIGAATVSSLLFNPIMIARIFQLLLPFCIRER